MGIASLFARRNVLKATAVLGGLSMLSERTASAQGDQRSSDGAIEGRPDEVRVADIPPSSTAKITVERRGKIVLIGINRPYIHNRVDPETYNGLAKAYYQYDHDPSLRAAVLFGHGDDFSRGIDVDAFQAAVASDRPRITERSAIDPLARTTPILSKPLLAVVHGDTWNMGHELYLAADIRVAAADTRFGQDENTHGRFPHCLKLYAIAFQCDFEANTEILKYQRTGLGSVRRFTDNNRFARGARSDLLLGRRRLSCGHPDLKGLDPGNMPR